MYRAICVEQRRVMTAERAPSKRTWAQKSRRRSSSLNLLASKWPSPGPPPRRAGSSRISLRTTAKPSRLSCSTVGRWYTDCLRQPQGEATRDALLVVDAVSGLYVFGDERMQSLVATGSLEALPFAHEAERRV